MSLLYPWLLWLLLPAVLFWYQSRTLTERVHALIVILLLLALARPILKEHVQKAKIEAQDIIIALDVSYSMQAKDLSPSRYGYAKAMINALLEKNPGANIMLIAYTTNPLLLSPPTTDHTLISIALESLRPDYILTKGTSLAHLFEALPKLHSQGKDLILITDGGEEKDLGRLAILLKKTGTFPVIVALGTTEGATITDKEGKALTDRQGNLVISHINPLLQKLSQRTDGIYITADTSPRSTAEEITHALQSRRHTVEKQQQHYTELYWIPLLFAVILFLLVHTSARKYLLLLPLLFGIEAQAGIFDLYHLEHAYHAYRQGDYTHTLRHLDTIETPTLQQSLLEAAALYRLRRYATARRRYLQIKTRSPHLKQQLYYDIANTYALEGNYDKAKIYYTKALQLGEDRDAAYNLALIIHLQTKMKQGHSLPRSEAQQKQQGRQGTSEAEEKRKKTKQSYAAGNGQGGGVQKRSKNRQRSMPKRLKSDQKAQKHPLGSKVYELINKGYVRETKPW
jgi:Ca-activated chloride channel family protein